MDADPLRRIPARATHRRLNQPTTEGHDRSEPKHDSEYLEVDLSQLQATDSTYPYDRDGRKGSTTTPVYLTTLRNRVSTPLAKNPG